MSRRAPSPHPRGHALAPAGLLALILAVLLPLVALASGPPGYRFTVVAALGDTAPNSPGDGPAQFTNDFEPYGLNNRGEISFVADMTTGSEGVFVGRPGALAQVLRAGQPAPGGGALGGFGSFTFSSLNESGDVAVAFGNEPFTLPVGINGGVYRYTHATRSLSAVVIPNVTPAPEGGVFVGSGSHASLNNRGAIAFVGLVPTQNGIRLEGQPYTGIGAGIFRADRLNHIVSVVSPGDVAGPGGGRFDYAANPWLNDGGDVAFGAHVAGEECIDGRELFCAESVYLKRALTGQIVSIAHQGAPAPGGGTYRLAFGPVLNNRGEIVFAGDLTAAPNTCQTLGVFLYSHGATRPIARPGDALPGGGHAVTTSCVVGNYFLNNRGDVSFNATLDTDDNGDGHADTGLYVATQAGIRLVVRSGDVIPGVGTVAHLGPPGTESLPWPTSGAILNDQGQVLFQALLTDGRDVLLLASPRH